MGLIMISGENRTARLRTRYTGEPKNAALHAFRLTGRHFGLVPDAIEAGQRRLEALLLRTLARPHAGLAEPAAPGSVWGLSGASPAPNGLVLWPAPGQAAGLLARWLPTGTAAGEIVGVPGLRAAASPSRPRDTVNLALAGHRARVELRAEPSALHHAALLAADAGLEVLWHTDAPSPAESEAHTALASQLDRDEIVLWSRALRRLGLARTVGAAWSHRAPREDELEGPHPKRIAPRPSGPGIALRGVVAVISGDGRGGNGCTTAAYVLAAAAAAGGARVGFLTGDDTTNLPSLLGWDRVPAGGWRDATSQLPAGGPLQVALTHPDQDQATGQVEAARAAFDLVVVDAGFQQPHLAAHADAVLALIPDQVPWSQAEVIDERSPRVQIWSHLNELRLSRPTADTFDLPTFLDQSFEAYVEWRAEQEGLVLPASGDQDDDDDGLRGDAHPAVDSGFDDEYATGDDDGEEDAEGDALGFDEEESEDEGWIEPYDPQSAEDADLFWQRSIWSPVTWATKPVLPPEEDAPYLDVWREEFLQILALEGARRHPEVWEEVAGGWRERNRARNQERVPSGAQTAAERAAAEKDAVEDLSADGVDRWGEESWRHESTAWQAAGYDERREVADAEPDLVWTVHHPRPPKEVAGELRALARRVPLGRPVVVAMAHPRRDLDGHLLAEVGRELRELGVADATVIPHSRALQEWIGAQQLEMAALAVGWALAAEVHDAVDNTPC
jgi:hypothetical protein